MFHLPLVMKNELKKTFINYEGLLLRNDAIPGLGATVLLFALGLLFTALWRRYFSESYYYLEDKGTDAGKCKIFESLHLQSFSRANNV